MVQSVDPLTDELIRLTDLRTRLIDEHTWSTVMIGLTSVGIPADVIAAVSGVDIASERSAAIADVDAAAAMLDMSLSISLAELRALATTATIDDTRERDLVALFAVEYELLEEDVVARSGEVFDRLAAIAGRVPGGDRLLTSLRTLQAAAEARQTIASLTIGSFITQFTDVVLQDLIEHRAAFERASTEIERLVRPGSRVDTERATIEAHGDTARLVLAVDQLIEQQVTRGRGMQEVLVGDVLGRLDDVVAEYETGSRAIDAHLALLDAAGSDVVNAGDELLADADADRAGAQTLIAALLGLVGLLAVLFTRALVKPLRQLAQSARRLLDGEIGVVSESRGPAEVRDANEAIREAATQLQLVQEQATALAAGDLDDPVLATPAPNPIGRSLHAAVSTLAASISERESYRLQLTYDATHDPLTRLPNRRAILSHLEQSVARTKRGGTGMAVLFIDLDGFKAVNDHRGHLAGDAVLQAIAERMQSAIRDTDHVGRFGGDEFVVVAQPIEGEHGAIELAERLADAIEVPIVIDHELVSIGASVGVFLPGEEDLTPDEILHSADLAAYRVKHARRVEVDEWAQRDSNP